MITHLPPVERLTIEFEKPEQWPSSPPQDDLHEMPHFEFAMQRFLFENNHRILLSVGKFTKSLHLFPDIALVLRFFPGVILSLSHGEAVDLTFPESQVFIEFSPHNGLMHCTLGTFGADQSAHLVVLDANQTTGEMKHFLKDVLMRAVAAGYILKEEAGGFLALVGK